MEPVSYRHEIKRLLSPAQACLLKQRIDAMLHPDSYCADTGDYKIRSVYFDTVTDSAYTDKENGICDREKIRIRFYNYKDDIILLERKIKRENLIHKESCPISREMAEAISKGDFSGLGSLNYPTAAYVYNLAHAKGLHPVVVVDYVRAAYVYPVGDMRITFDSALCSGDTYIPLWERGNTFDVLGEQTILEIKFQKYFPVHIRNLLNSVPGDNMALSKYVLCRQNILHKHGNYLGGKL